MLLSTLFFSSAFAQNTPLQCSPGVVEVDHWCEAVDPNGAINAITGRKSCPMVDRELPSGAIQKIAKSYPHGRSCSWPCGVPTQISLNQMFQDEYKTQMANQKSGHEAVHIGREKVWAECRRLCDENQDCTSYTMNYKYFGCYLSTHAKPCGEYKYSCHHAASKATWFETGPNCAINAALSMYTVKNCRATDLSQACPAARPPTESPTPDPTESPTVFVPAPTEPVSEKCMLVANACPQMRVSVLNRLSTAEVANEENFSGTFEECVALAESHKGSKGAGYIEYTPGKSCHTWVVRGCVNGAVSPPMCPQPATPAPKKAATFEPGQCRLVSTGAGAADHFKNGITKKGRTQQQCAQDLIEAQAADAGFLWAEYSGDSRGMCWIGRNVNYGGNSRAPYVCIKAGPASEVTTTAAPATTTTDAPATTAAPKDESEKCMLVENACPQMRVRVLGRLNNAEVANEENFSGTFEECVALAESQKGSKGAGYIEYTPGKSCHTWVVRNCINGAVSPPMCPKPTAKACDAGIHMNHNGLAMNLLAGTKSDLITESACACESACEQKQGCAAWTFLPDGVMWPKNTCVLRKRCHPNGHCGFNPNFVEPNQRSGELPEEKPAPAPSSEDDCDVPEADLLKRMLRDAKVLVKSNDLPKDQATQDQWAKTLKKLRKTLKKLAKEF